ncbi:MAG: hypothetical protein BGP12_19035 [Rhodospirillales bacterium 70-18]|nr:MAG: hypothetical protein BGP12_19035 [Rhodospirillales bacterium 70-18]
MALTYATVTTAAELAQDITDLSGQTGSFTITIGADFTLDRALSPLVMGSGGTVSILGGGHTISGANTYQGLFVATGTVALDSLTLANMKAHGGNAPAAYYSGGGGMGAGGALFVGSGGNVTLQGVSFSGNAAVGGNGGNYVSALRTPGAGGSLSGSGGLPAYAGGGGGATGGFGGGGGGYASGGFGGGGGGRSGSGGFGAGSSSWYSGGGGLGAGGAIFVRQGGVLSIGAGGISGGSVTAGSGGNSGGSGGSAFGSGLFIQGNTTLTLAPGAAGTLAISDVIADQTGNGGTGGNAGAGALSLASGTAHLSAANTFTGGITVASGATLDLGAATAAGSGAITLAGDGAALLLDSGITVTNTLAALSHLDSITLAGLTGTGVSVVGSSLRVATSGATISFALDSSAYSTSDFTLTQSGGDAVVAYTACYAAGTRIATPDGEVAVEHLRAGDLVSTADGGARPVRWLGWRSIDCAAHPRPADVLPVRVRAGAVLPGLPARDLVLSPDHALALDGVLIPVRYLLNGATVAQEPAGRISYYHVELAGPDGAAVHDVLLAEGLPAESYLDTGNRAAFANGGPATQMHPDFAAGRALAVWAANACAELALDGPAVAAVRALLDSRALDLGWRRDATVLPTLEVDGAVLHPGAHGLCFDLPEGATRAVLRSASFVPAQMHADRDDHRSLGVAVRWLALDGRAVRLEGLAEGWHAPEPGLRWTDGAGRIDLHGARRLELHLAALGDHWVAPAARRLAA